MEALFDFLTPTILDGWLDVVIKMLLVIPAPMGIIISLLVVGFVLRIIF